MVHLLEHSDVKDRLPEAMTAEAWEAIRPNLHHMGEVAEGWQVVTGPITAGELNDEDRDFLRQACATLISLNWTDMVWTGWTGPITAGEVNDEDRDFLRQACETLLSLNWTDMVWKDWTGALKESTGRKGKTLFMPLRRALTGLDHGPDMGALLPLIGRDAAIERLITATA